MTNPHAGMVSTEDQEWYDNVLRFARETLAPGATHRSLAEELDLNALQALGVGGYYGLAVSTQSGGSGATMTQVSLAYEAIATVDFSLALTLQVQGQMARLLEALDADRAVPGITKSMATGDMFVAIGMSEAQGGSDMANIKTKIVNIDSDHLQIQGSKQFVSNGGTPLTRYHLVIGVDDEGRSRAALVPISAPGVMIAKAYHKSGWRAADTRAVFYDKVVVPASLELGTPGTAYKEIVKFFSVSRIPFSAMCVGLAQACVEITSQFVRGRNSFGQPLVEHQAISFTLAEMLTRTETARAAVYRAAALRDMGDPAIVPSAIAKLDASEAAQWVAARACQLHGGAGFLRDSPVNRYYLDSLNLTIGEGTSEMMKLIISRDLLRS